MFHKKQKITGKFTPFFLGPTESDIGVHSSICQISFVTQDDNRYLKKF